jgi:hypothetical protein
MYYIHKMNIHILDIYFMNIEGIYCAAPRVIFIPLSVPWA